MDYEFDYKIKTKDMLLITLKGIYNSLAGAINIVFTFSMLALVVRFSGEVSFFVTGIALLFALYFPLIQPLIIYKRLNKQISLLPDNLKISFNNKGFTLKSNNDSSSFKWSNIKRISKTKNMILIFISNKDGYIITKDIAGDKFDELYNFILTKTK